MFGEYDQVIGQIVHLLIWVDSFLFFSYWGYFMTYGYDHGNRPTMHHYIISSENQESKNWRESKSWSEVKRWNKLSEDEKLLDVGKNSGNYSGNLLAGHKIGKVSKPDMHYVVMLAQEIRDSKRSVSNHKLNHKNEDFQVEIYKVC